MIHEAQAAEAWKRATFTNDEVVLDYIAPDPLAFFCRALVRESTIWRRCHSWTFGTRGGKPVCVAHYRSREVAWEKE